MNNLTKINHCVLGIHLSLYSPCKIVTETKETDFDDSDYKKKKSSMAGKITGAPLYHRIRDKVTHV